MSDDNELVFAPLGGLGEIGMNCALYGFGPPRGRKWLMVDLGVAFAGDDLPGVDLILPDLALHREGEEGSRRHHHHACARGPYRRPRRSLAAARRAGLCDALRRRPRRNAPPRRARRAEDPDQDRRARARGSTSARSTSSSFRRAFDPRELRPGHPHAGRPRRPYRRLEDRPDAAGRHADRRGAPAGARRRRRSRAVCNSTNVLREGESPSEADVATKSRALVGKAKGRVIVTTFASNVARLRAAAEAGLRRRPAGHDHRPRDGARRRGGARMRLSRRRAAACSARTRSSACRATRFWRSPPAARASRAPRWRASPRTSIRSPSLAAAISSSSPRAPFPATRRRSARSSTASSAGRRGRHRPRRSWSMSPAIRAAPKLAQDVRLAASRRSRFPRMASRCI